MWEEHITELLNCITLSDHYIYSTAIIQNFSCLKMGLRMVATHYTERDWPDGNRRWTLCYCTEEYAFLLLFQLIS